MSADQGDYRSAARNLIDGALAASPDDPYGHYYSGLVHLRAGEAQAALGDFEKALEGGYPVQLLAGDPQLEALRSDSRFRRLVESSED